MGFTRIGNLVHDHREDMLHICATDSDARALAEFIQAREELIAAGIVEAIDDEAMDLSA